MGDANQNQPIPPIMRGLMIQASDLNGKMAYCTRGNPGMHNGILYKDIPWCYATGWRDAGRGRDVKDKGNQVRLRDPFCNHGLTALVTGQLVWALHKSKLLDCEQELGYYLPEIEGSRFEMLTPREILGYNVPLDENAVLSTMGIQKPSRWLPNYGTRFRAEVHQPLRKKFGESAGLTPRECRSNMLRHIVDHAEKIPKVKKVTSMGNPSASRPCHFGFALMAAAIERVLEKSFEDLMQERIFNPQELKSPGFGIPKVVAKSDTFFQPQSGSNAHDGWTGKPSVQFGDASTAGPSIFNSSMNLFSEAQDFGALMTLVPLTFQEVMDAFPRDSVEGVAPHCEFGVRYNPQKDVLSLNSPLSTKNYHPLPWSYGFKYNRIRKTGGWCVGNSGGFTARYDVGWSASFNERILWDEIVRDGVDVFDESGNKKAMDRLNKRKDSAWYKMFVAKEAHTRL